MSSGMEKKKGEKKFLFHIWLCIGKESPSTRGVGWVTLLVGSFAVTPPAFPPLRKTRRMRSGIVVSLVLAAMLGATPSLGQAPTFPPETTVPGLDTITAYLCTSSMCDVPTCQSQTWSQGACLTLGKGSAMSGCMGNTIMFQTYKSNNCSGVPTQTSEPARQCIQQGDNDYIEYLCSNEPNSNSGSHHSGSGSGNSHHSGGSGSAPSGSGPMPPVGEEELKLVAESLIHRRHPSDIPIPPAVLDPRFVEMLRRRLVK